MQEGGCPHSWMIFSRLSDIVGVARRDTRDMSGWATIQPSGFGNSTAFTGGEKSFVVFVFATQLRADARIVFLAPPPAPRPPPPPAPPVRREECQRLRCPPVAWLWKRV